LLFTVNNVIGHERHVKAIDNDDSFFGKKYLFGMFVSKILAFLHLFSGSLQIFPSAIEKIITAMNS
jgi:hypothetical protein